VRVLIDPLQRRDHVAGVDPRRVVDVQRVDRRPGSHADELAVRTLPRRDPSHKRAMPVRVGVRPRLSRHAHLHEPVTEIGRRGDARIDHRDADAAAVIALAPDVLRLVAERVQRRQLRIVDNAPLPLHRRIGKHETNVGISRERVQILHLDAGGDAADQRQLLALLRVLLEQLVRLRATEDDRDLVVLVLRVGELTETLLHLRAMAAVVSAGRSRQREGDDERERASNEQCYEVRKPHREQPHRHVLTESPSAHDTRTG
jgi:hypothetical protein